MIDRQEFNRIVNDSVKDLLRMDVDTYNKVKIVLLSYRDEYEPCNEYKRKLFEFTDRHRLLLIEMK
ncbi:hypothetical protein OCV51_08500 [Faecalicatena acetigenes]|uniref:Uncharacterized protein n=1 Tax=Faecalicatena acetigenes TaxID=2981790 RepID=A0ABT2TBN3_9FIRM|nr:MULTISPECIES: hypothetical protein [Lachnospiraceae]MCU6747688.1 hypothetical protein [Faecalicatena acetigenes]RGT75130.1 hypothetical protein DWX08_01350 [Ruminococcus sp. AF18-22]SCI03720.1 Uncharacterised protein [uncultured Clostridium sp.]